MKYDVAIAGAGIMGLSCAFELAQAGAKVLVMDPNPPGTKASWAAAGILVTRGAQRTFSPFRSFYVRSIESYPTWLRRIEAVAETAIPLTQAGDYQIFDTDAQKGCDALAAKLQQMKREAAPSPTVISGLPPFLIPFGKSAGFTTLFHSQEAYVQNRTLLEALEKAVKKLGVQLARITPAFPNWVSTADGVQISLDAGTIYAKQLLLTAGVWTSKWLKSKDLDCSLIPVKGQVMRIPKPYAEKAMVHLREDLYLIPRDEYLVVGATTEPNLWDEQFNDQGKNELTFRLESFLPGLPKSPVETWAGLRPRHRDRLPLMGVLPDTNHVFLCSGHYKCGISMAPLAAQCIAAEMRGERPVFDLSPFHPGRKGALKQSA